MRIPRQAKQVLQGYKEGKDASRISHEGNSSVVGALRCTEKNVGKVKAQWLGCIFWSYYHKGIIRATDEEDWLL